MRGKMTKIKKKMILGTVIIVLLIGCGIYIYAQCVGPVYQSSPWDTYDVRINNNCYSYAFNTMKSTFPHSPGYGSGFDECFPFDATDCCLKDEGEMVSRVLADMKKKLTLNISLSSASGSCLTGGTKVYMAIKPYDPNNPSIPGDVHFYRQDGPGGEWSHKRGSSFAINYYDYDDWRDITDPEDAAASLGYTVGGTYFCYCAGTTEQGATGAPIQ